jgi:hypothetical protein
MLVMALEEIGPQLTTPTVRPVCSAVTDASAISSGLDQSGNQPVVKSFFLPSMRMLG